jgi:glutathione S-transferase
MRARMALHASGVAVELREVELRNKPASMLAASPKGSVPVLVLPDGCVIDESWDIMQWALHQHDPEGWLGEHDAFVSAAEPLISANDTSFKLYLDRYKYADRYPEQTRLDYRTQAEVFLRQLEERLSATRYLLGNTQSIADAGIFPFIRQFAEVDKDWFAQAPYPALRVWLADILSTPRFAAVMRKTR